MQDVTAEHRIVGPPAIRITLKSTAKRYLTKLDPERDALLIVWGSEGRQREPGWLISTCRSEDLPPKALQESLVARLHNIRVVIPQRQRATALDGKIMHYRHGSLVLE